MEEKKNTHAYILAGGKSSRMGTDKAVLMLEGKTILQRIIDELRPAVEKIIIVSDNPEHGKFGMERIPDKIKNSGPAGGIYTVLAHCSSEKMMVVSCDMPFIKTEAVLFMLENSKDSQITVPVFQNQLEPMFAVYSKSCLAKWAELIGSGTFKLQHLFGHFTQSKIVVDANPLFVGPFFMNMNSSEDFNKAKTFVKHDN